MAAGVKRLTWRKTDRALVALVELIECTDVTDSEKVQLNEAANRVRSLRDRAAR